MPDKDPATLKMEANIAEKTGRLEASGSFNAMVSHRVRLESARDVDAEVVGWLKEAFDAAG